VSSTTLTVAILAGGAASRLGGRDKGLETLDGEPIVARVVDFVARRVANAEMLIIANRNVETYARYARVVGDAEAGFRGPLAGVASALAHATTTNVLTLPVDCPTPPDDLATRLAAALDAGDFVAAVAHDGERRQPLFALYRRTLAASAADAATTGQGVFEWQNGVGAIEVDFADAKRQFHNLNTPEDFRDYADGRRARD
jgi:molybdopterin-guanine dinucleotide biosynthesis protein A